MFDYTVVAGVSNATEMSKDSWETIRRNPEIWIVINYMTLLSEQSSDSAITT